jgi:ribosome-associated protein
MNEIAIDSEFIKLGQLLKLAGMADSGSYAKVFITEGQVKVNGEVDLRRGRKVYKGDTVTFGDESVKVI